MAAEKTVDGYIAGLADWRGEIVSAVREVIRNAAPEARESIKWAQPVWESNGPIAYVKAFPRAVNLGFWRGTDLDDPADLLSGDGDRMRHIKLTAADQLDRETLAGWVRQAVALNAGKGDPTRR
jgi:hypothetical protein